MTRNDPIAMLKQDHEHVQELFSRLEVRRGGGDPEGLIEELARSLRNHTELEEQIVYPAFQAAAEGHREERLYFESIEEHHLVDQVLELLDRSEPGTPQHAARVKVLRDLVSHHIEEEEEALFPLLRELCDEDKLAAIAKDMEQQRILLEEEDLDRGELERLRAGGKVDLNHADVDELQRIEGVGPAGAARIVEYREEYGPFEDWAELEDIEGISEQAIERLREQATLGH